MPSKNKYLFVWLLATISANLLYFERNYKYYYSIVKTLYLTFFQIYAIIIVLRRTNENQ